MNEWLPDCWDYAEIVKRRVPIPVEHKGMCFLCEHTFDHVMLSCCGCGSECCSIGAALCFDGLVYCFECIASGEVEHFAHEIPKSAEEFYAEYGDPDTWTT